MYPLIEKRLVPSGTVVSRYQISFNVFIQVRRKNVQIADLPALATYLYKLLYYYIDTYEIPGLFLLLKNHIFIARNEDTMFFFHVCGYWCRRGY